MPGNEEKRPAKSSWRPPRTLSELSKLSAGTDSATEAYVVSCELPGPHSLGDTYKPRVHLHKLRRCWCSLQTLAWQMGRRKDSTQQRLCQSRATPRAQDPAIIKLEVWARCVRPTANTWKMPSAKLVALSNLATLQLKKLELRILHAPLALTPQDTVAVGLTRSAASRLRLARLCCLLDSCATNSKQWHCDMR